MCKIEYFELPELPGKPMFRCEKRKATIQTASCANMWREGHVKGAHERYMSCRGCPIGAEHAGVKEATLSPIYAAPICARCQRGATRLIHGNLCVSCQNRQYEYIKGRNARGNAPVTHPPLYHLAIRYMTDGKIKTVIRDNVASSIELIIAALRDEPKQVTFCAVPPRRPPTPQLELFA